MINIISLAHYPYYITFTKNHINIRSDQTTIASFYPYHQTSIIITNTALLNTLTQEKRITIHHKLLQVHLTLLNILFFSSRRDSLHLTGKFPQLLIRTDNLNCIAGKQTDIGTRNVDTMHPANNRSNMHPIFISQIQLFQCMSCPKRIRRHLEIRKMNIT